MEIKNDGINKEEFLKILNEKSWILFSLDEKGIEFTMNGPRKDINQILQFIRNSYELSKDMTGEDDGN